MSERVSVRASRLLRAGDNYPLYVLMALGMSTQGISNMLAYGASSAVRRHVLESLESCCGCGGGARVGRGEGRFYTIHSFTHSLVHSLAPQLFHHK